VFIMLEKVKKEIISGKSQVGRLCSLDFFKPSMSDLLSLAFLFFFFGGNSKVVRVFRMLGS